jgi:phenylalanyl-tRNA synthetase alpha chain
VSALPKELEPAAIEAATNQALDAISKASDLEALKAVKLQYVGDKSALAIANRQIGTLSAEQKVDVGARIGKARQTINALFTERERALERISLDEALENERVDITEALFTRLSGARHPISMISERVADVFTAMGWEIKEGPELEAEWLNFDALNIPGNHPARSMQDTFYIGDENSHLVLRTHTSPVQARVMLSSTPPIYVGVPGRVFRTDELDATHTPVFHQVEALAVDKGLTMADLRGTLDHFAQALFGPHAKTRLRPSYFPFTEPSAELDLWFEDAKGGARWIEWGGCGMVNPAVLRACGIDPEEYSGFAFGVGLERTAMFRHTITDMRDIVEGDIRFSRQFGVDPL